MKWNATTWLLPCCLILACVGEHDRAEGIWSADDGDGPGGSGTGNPDGGDEGGADDGGDGGTKFDVQPDQDDDGEQECPPVDYDATLTGVVHAPNGEVPVSGALVYVSGTRPAGIPQTVYCADCEGVGTCNPETLTTADGSFALSTRAGDGKYLVVTKGQFMRITPMDVPEGTTALDAGVTELPGHNAPDDGQYIPKIAVGLSSPDDFELILAKVGLGQVADNGAGLVPNTAQFDAYDNDKDPSWYGMQSKGDFAALLADPARLDQYHIIFFACIGASSLDDELDVSPEVRDNLRAWVGKGGRVYATDYAVRWIEGLFPSYQSVNGEPGGIEFLHRFETLATVLDSELLAWLQALPNPLKDVNPLNPEGDLEGKAYPTLFELPKVRLIENFSGIEYPLPEITADDGQGEQIDVGHRAWLEGPWAGKGGLYPPAVIAQYGCGRIHFTSYHSVGIPHEGLIPQELIMLYSILEIGVCQTPALPAG